MDLQIIYQQSILYYRARHGITFANLRGMVATARDPSISNSSATNTRSNSFSWKNEVQEEKPESQVIKSVWSRWSKDQTVVLVEVWKDNFDKI